MATCAECVHVEVCSKKNLHVAVGMNITPRFKYERIEQECDDFKDCSRFVELPCKVGDTVYFNNVHLRHAKVIAIYIDASGGMFDLDIATNIETVAGYEHFINKDYTFEDIGRRLFLTSEAAEQALKERENHGKAQ